ncbi:MAG: Molybdenum transport system permease protein ModB [Alphaproteobacteria bacterium MarineAlpha9_Bin4]|nr:molybdate ABC transporter permease subunit [Pelagibacterales bacterium]PPR26503.1 MAG: Molybdenum transport system permease protein ModB [Alphaproteobacteria bacterium MarineAlpha9_Bin4]
MINFSEEEVTVIIISFKIATIAALSSLPFGIWVGFVLARKTFPFKKLLISIINLPLILPPVVTGYLLLILFGKNGFLGKFLLDYFNFSFAFKWTGAALACAIMGFPLMVRSIKLAIEMIDIKIENAAKTLGASPLKVFFTITLPISIPGIIVGTTLSFARALGEFGATITFVSNIPGETQTISAAIYTFLQIPNGEAMAMRLTIISIIVSIFAILFSEIILEKVLKTNKENE